MSSGMERPSLRVNACSACLLLCATLTSSYGNKQNSNKTAMTAREGRKVSHASRYLLQSLPLSHSVFLNVHFLINAYLSVYFSMYMPQSRSPLSNHFPVHVSSINIHTHLLSFCFFTRYKECVVFVSVGLVHLLDSTCFSVVFVSIGLAHALARWYLSFRFSFFDQSKLIGFLNTHRIFKSCLAEKVLDSAAIRCQSTKCTQAFL